MKIVPIAPGDYVRTVLPQTYPFWGGGRSYHRYVADFLTTAQSWRVRPRRFTVALSIENEAVSSCKLYWRSLRWNGERLRALGIGAVFTPPSFRGRGYASAMLGAVLDDAVREGADIAFLFSDIQPAFYARLGFVEFPSRRFTVRASALSFDRVTVSPIADEDWAPVRRCFERMERGRSWSFTRTAATWTGVRDTMTARSPRGTQSVCLAVKRGSSVRAYVFGRRVAQAGELVVRELGFAGDDARALLQPLLRAAAGDLDRVTGWLPPEPARDALTGARVTPRRKAVLMMASLSREGRRWSKACGPDAQSSRGDAVWIEDHV